MYGWANSFEKWSQLYEVPSPERSEDTFPKDSEVSGAFKLENFWLSANCRIGQNVIWVFGTKVLPFTATRQAGMARVASKRLRHRLGEA